MKLTIEFQKEKQDGGNVEYRYSLQNYLTTVIYSFSAPGIAVDSLQYVHISYCLYFKKFIRHQMYRHRLRPVVACLIIWYRCISVMLLFSFPFVVFLSF